MTSFTRRWSIWGIFLCCGIIVFLFGRTGSLKENSRNKPNEKTTVPGPSEEILNVVNQPVMLTAIEVARQLGFTPMYEVNGLGGIEVGKILEESPFARAGLSDGVVVMGLGNSLESLTPTPAFPMLGAALRKLELDESIIAWVKDGGKCHLLKIQLR